MATTASPPPTDSRRRASVDRLKSVFSTAIRRASIPRRESYDKDVPTASTSSTGSTTSPEQPSFSPIEEPRSPAISDITECSSLHEPHALLNSSSPASELPTTWAEWNRAYALGLMDFNDPPPPPTSLASSKDQQTSTGQFRAPFPLQETRRQRAVDNIGLINHQSCKRSRLGPKSSGDESEPIPAPTTIASTGGVSLIPPMPKDLATHPKLLELAQEAKRRFSTEGSTVSFMDGPSQVFLAEEGFGVDELPRESTVCSHTMLKATTGQRDPLVVLNLKDDWRFTQNNFGQYGGGFYAAAPIMLPSPMGDPEEMYPAGIFCIIDDKPRTSFSSEDRLMLEEMADLAGAEIIRAAGEVKDVKRGELKAKREAWKRSKLVKRVSDATKLDTVPEVSTPPQSPELVTLEGAFTGLGGLGAASDPSEASADAPESVSDGPSEELGITDSKPTFAKGRKGVHAPQPRLPDDIKAVFDLSTQLVGESLDFDFCYVVSIDLPTSSTTSPRKSSDRPVRLLSSHNIPIPAPLFDVDLHIETLTSSHSAILFTDPEFTGAEGEFSCGLLLKVAVSDDVGYVLGCFSEDPRRVLNKQDYNFVRSFARDLQQYTAKL